jgi:hypothetical protein
MPKSRHAFSSLYGPVSAYLGASPAGFSLDEAFMIAMLNLNTAACRSRLFATAILCGGILLTTPESAAITISYQVEDLADLVVGEDLRRYSYSVSDFAFERNQGFTIFFDAEKYRNLDVTPAAPNADWDIITGEPVPLLGLPGVYDALSIVALGDTASLANPFTLSFEWIGAGDPGSQPFEVNEFDADGNFLATLATGDTTAAIASVPDGGSMALLFGLGLGSIALARRRLRFCSLICGRN